VSPQTPKRSAVVVVLSRVVDYFDLWRRRDRPVGGGQRQRDSGLPAHQPARQEYSQECARHSVPRTPPLPRQVALHVVWVRSVLWNPVLRIRDVYPGSRIPDLNFFPSARQTRIFPGMRSSHSSTSSFSTQTGSATRGGGHNLIYFGSVLWIHIRNIWSGRSVVEPEP
jgi:hypothetical protein